MSFNYSPKIITDGLVLYLDAANKRSYPGSGTIWSDLSKNGNNGTLTNGPTFNSANGGSIVFDGTNDYIGLGTSTSLVPPYLTTSIFVYINNYSSRPHLIGRGESQIGHFYFVVEAHGVFRFWYDVGNGWSYLEPSNFIFPTATWYNIACTFDGSTINVYGNSSLIANQSIVGQLRQYTAQETVLGRISTVNYLNGKISSVQVYNRALTSSEISQNYNATKTRFGL